ncbi:MAG: hypothetical protein NTY75_01775 [Candidatus Shapirobacteria bacterium]|nr:hypothetical protein [Candidatus Shapirobacteria bacterium]
MPLSKDNIVGVIDLETLNHPDISTLVDRVFNRTNMGKIEKVDFGRSPLFKWVWKKIVESKSPMAGRYDNVIGRIVNGRTLFGGTTSEDEVHRFTTAFETRARRSGITGINCRILGIYGPTSCPVDEVIFVIRRRNIQEG